MLEGLIPAWVSREVPHNHNRTRTIMMLHDITEKRSHNLYRNHAWTSRTWVYSSSPPFLERLLLRDARRLGAAFLLLRLRDLPRRFADFLLGAAFLRAARRLFGAMINCNPLLLCGGDTITIAKYHNPHSNETTTYCTIPTQDNDDTNH